MLTGLRRGRYKLTLRPTRIRQADGHALVGATATSSRPTSTVRVGDAAHPQTLTAAYTTIVNPGVRRTPPVLAVSGDRKDPVTIVVARRDAPSPGEVLTSGPTPLLPLGLLARVTNVRHKGPQAIISLRAVPVDEAVPELRYQGALHLKPIPGAATARSATTVANRARAADACVPPELLKLGAQLDSVELREAFLGTWPPQIKLTLAVRTTESLGLAVAVVGINCDFTLAELGPFSAAIPVGPIVIPVYATVPLKAGVHINGRLEAATVHVASTTIAHAAAGVDETSASLSQQGTNVWTDGTLALSGDVNLSASIGVQAWIGIATGANVHVEAGFGPEFDWSTGHECELLLDLGTISAGATVLGHTLNTPGFTPFKLHLWKGCAPGGSGPGGSGPGGGGPPVVTPPAPPLPITTAVEVAGGGFFSCARLADAHVACWGWGLNPYVLPFSGYGPQLVPGVSGATSLTTGEESSCAVVSGGKVICWGYNDFGELGDGSTESTGTPHYVQGISNAVAVSAGATHACAALSTGEVRCWGRNWKGELGDGTESGPETCLVNKTEGYACSTTPVAVLGIKHAVGISAGGDKSCALLTGGTVDCWGATGFGTGTSSPEPVAISEVKALSTGWFQTCALLTSGRIACWGENGFGGLGNGSETATGVQEVLGITDATALSTGDDHSCAALSTGRDVCWGENSFGELGDGSTTGPEQCGSPTPSGCSRQPVQVQGLSTVVGVGVGEWHSCALLATRSVACWGQSNGEVPGTEEAGSDEPASLPVPVP